MLGGRISRRLRIIVRRVAARIAASAGTTVPGTTPRVRIPCRRRTAGRVRPHWAARMRPARLRGRTATEGTKAWVHRAAAATGVRRVVEEAGLRRVAVVEEAGRRRAAVVEVDGARRVEAENDVDLL